ncbi:MAG: DUF1015 family protein [Chloroflexi bacterium]|nr:DUF1015 family protein [Chloroflexota bacterium]
MAIVRPFKGLRPKKELASKVAALPYDVMNSEEARKMADGNPYCFLHISKAEIDLPSGTDIYDDSVYQKSKENFYRFIKEGILRQDTEPCFYVYRQVMPVEGGHHSQVGLVAGASVDEYQKDIILKHEQTRQDKEDDRTRNVDTLNANTGPVFLTYIAKPEIDAIIDKIMEGTPENDFTSDDGIRHTFWVVSDKKIIEKIEEKFASLDHLYVADGHHRSASASRVRDMRMKANPGHTGDEEYNFFLAVIFPHDQMQIMDYNRVIKDLNGLSEEEFMVKAAEKFDIEAQDAPLYKPSEKHSFGLYISGKWYRLTPKPGTFDENDAVGSLDVSILQENLLDPVLGIKNPRTDKRIDFVGGIRGIKELVRLVDSGKFSAAFAFYPTSINDLIEVADAGKFMPPKSTWFEPKLRSGLAVHLLT